MTQSLDKPSNYLGKPASSSLPDEMTMAIFSFLKPKDLAIAARVCKL